MSNPERAERIVRNEARFRDINDRLEAGLRTLVGDDEAVSFVCECGNAVCEETVSLTFAAYEEVRADDRSFVVLAGHEIPDVEDVVARNDGHNVVRKRQPVP